MSAPSAAPIYDVIPVTVLTGFLGAGKTTLLSRLLRHPGLRDTAVIINEFGEVGLDHLLVEKSGETLVELNSGCLCCTVRGDLIDTLNMLFLKRVKGEVPYFKRVVIETTGLADPAPVLHSLLNDPMIIAHYDLDGVIAVVDALNGADTLDRHREAVKQAAVADRIVLSKIDLLTDGVSRDRIERRLRALNPAARFLTPDEALGDPMAFLSGGFYDVAERPEEVRDWLRAEAYAEAAHDHDHHDHGNDHAHEHGHAHAAPDVNRHDDHVQAYCIVRDAPISGMAFSLFLELLIANRGADLLRVKGILNIAEKPATPAVIHGVQHVFHPVVWLDAWPDDDRRSKLVFIVRDIPREQIEALLGALDGTAGMNDAEIGATMVKGESLLRNGLKA